MTLTFQWCFFNQPYARNGCADGHGIKTDFFLYARDQGHNWLLSGRLQMSAWFRLVQLADIIKCQIYTMHSNVCIFMPICPRRFVQTCTYIVKQWIKACSNFVFRTREYSPVIQPLWGNIGSFELDANLLKHCCLVIYYVCVSHLMNMENNVCKIRYMINKSD